MEKWEGCHAKDPYAEQSRGLTPGSTNVARVTVHFLTFNQRTRRPMYSRTNIPSTTQETSSARQLHGNDDTELEQNKEKLFTGTSRRISSEFLARED
jgi:hypothetical protein